MKNNRKKWIAVAGCLALCAVLVVLIGQQFKAEKPVDTPLSSQSSEMGDVTVDSKEPNSEEKEVIVTPPDTTQPESTDNGAVSSGTEQTIQGDVNKPEYTEEQLKDPTQKPNGEKVTEEDKPVEHDKVEKPKDTPKQESSPKPSGGNSIPGFDNVPNAGANQGEIVDGDGDINKQVGTMN
nr:DUF6550 family protein [Aminipila sp.]